MLLFLCYEDTQRVMVNFSPPQKKGLHVGICLNSCERRRVKEEIVVDD